MIISPHNSANELSFRLL